MDFTITELYYYRHNRNVYAPAIDEARVPFFDLTVALEGRLDYEIDGRRYTVGGGDAVLIPRLSTRKRGASETPADYVSFNFIPAGPLPFPVYFEKAARNKIKLLLAAADEINRDVTPYDEQKTCLLLSCILSVLQSELADKDVHPLVAKIERYLRQHYAERITLGGLGRALNYSPVYCDAVFKRETGRPIVSRLIELRLEEAKKLLIEGAAGLASVAEAVGFEDYNYFSRVFKKRVGYSPSKYRTRVLQTLM